MSFADYMESLGARQIPIAMNATVDPWRSNEDQQVYSYSNKPYGVGQQIPGLSGRQQREYNAGGYSSRTFDGLGATPGYVDSSGGFLGYGNSIADLQNFPGNSIGYSTYAANEPGRLAGVEAQRLANEQAAYDLQQQRAADRAAQQGTLTTYGGQGLIGMGQAPQQSSMGRGSGFAPGQQYTGGAGRGSGFAPGQQYAGGMGRGAGQGLIGGMGRGGPIGGVV